MDLYEKLLNKKEKLAVIGLGYVGLPIAVSFSEHLDVIGFDINEDKIKLYKQGSDPTKEVGDEKLSKAPIYFTNNEMDLQKAKFYIIAVPTAINADNTPDLNAIRLASELVGRNLTQGSVVVYESTVYPGLTEEFCLPILEENSGLRCGIDFKIGYSPERINPGDHEHRLENIVKIVSGMDDDSLEYIAKVYEIIVKAGVHKADSIKIAEAAKVIENSQRDINIAFMNELSILFHKMNIDMQKVLQAAGTKWNFLNFKPGLVGGHCIGVDPYYLTYKAEQIGYHSKIILAGRHINDEMGKVIAHNLIKRMILSDCNIKGSKVAILGITFKENCPDTRNSKVYDIITELKEFGIEVVVNDPLASKEEVLHHYNLIIEELDNIQEIDALVIAVSHDQYKNIDINVLKSFYKSEINNRILFDIKGIYNRDYCIAEGFEYGSL